MPASTGRSADLEIRLLGPLEVLAGGVSVELPRSKKTRALLAYLAATGREHTRTQLCSLLWDTTDDPRGALRWSLSKLRPVVNDATERLVADRSRVALATEELRIDVRDLASAVAADLREVETPTLERIATGVRGEFLEGLELADQFDFAAWCVAARERTREEHSAVLAELVRRLAHSPESALPFARRRVEADTFSVPARVELLELLVRSGKADEARQQFDLASRLFRELDVPGLSDLASAWSVLQRGTACDPGVAAELGNKPARRPRGETATSRRAATEVAPPGAARAAPPRLVGRRGDLERLRTALPTARQGSAETVVLVSGEPGAGKSHLAAVLEHEARRDGLTVLAGRAYEAESSRPFGPWADALGGEVTQWRSERRGDDAAASREGLFEAVAEEAATRAADTGALLLLDDIQWLDPDSAELLHFVVRVNRATPLAVVLLARSGELDDNEAALRMLRGLEREKRVERIDLEPLSRDEIGELLAASAGASVDAIYQASAGNPLFALELARAGSVGDGPAASLAHLVRQRVGRLPAAAADVLRWAAVLGHSFDVARLEELSSLDLDEMVDALERLEQHDLLHGDTLTGSYRFAHDVVREGVYGELSHPRRRLMHRRVARQLAPELPDPAVAKQVAHHARLGGEALLGVRACVDAGLGALRVFANADAEALARSGLDLVDELDRPQRIASTLDLLHIQFSARTPDRERAAARVEALAEEALDLGLTRPARLGFQMLSFLRWESSSMSDAHANILQAERVSRLAEPEERASALAHAARCFVLLERNMSQAEAFLLEAQTLTRRGDRSTSAVPFARAMLHAHRGELDEATKAFREARWLGREQGDRLAEFRAIEHWAMLEIDRGRYAEAVPLVEELAVLGEKVREGAEGACGRALLAVVRRWGEAGGAQPADDGAPGFPRGSSLPLDDAIESLRRADAKYELAFVLTRLAQLEIEVDDWSTARQLAAEGLECAIAIGRASDIALSHAVLARCAEVAEDRRAYEEHTRAVAELQRGELSSGVRRVLGELLRDAGPSAGPAGPAT